MRRLVPLSHSCAIAVMLFLPTRVPAQKSPAADPVTATRIRELPKRFKQIKPGMTKEQVWQTLGLPLNGVGFGGRGSGPVDRCSSVYWVGSYNLGLVFDDSLTHSRLKSATLLYNPPLQSSRRTKH